MAIRSLRLQEKEHRRAAKNDVSKFQSWHNNELFRAYRVFLVAKLLRIREEINLHDAKSLMVNQSIRVSLPILKNISQKSLQKQAIKFITF